MVFREARAHLNFINDVFELVVDSLNDLNALFTFATAILNDSNALIELETN